MLFDEAWGRSLCSAMQRLVDVDQEYPGGVEHIYSPGSITPVNAEQREERVEVNAEEGEEEEEEEEEVEQDTDDMCVSNSLLLSSVETHLSVRAMMMGRKLKDEGHTRTMSKFKDRRMDRSESERDSGFSDAGSEHLSAVDQTDTDDTSRSVGSAGAGSRSQPGAVLGGGDPSLVILILQRYMRPSGDNPATVKPRSFSPAAEVVQHPQVIFLQPTVPQTTVAVSKGAPTKRRRHKKYLPILKSYPKIAPHPGDSPQTGGSSSSASFVQSSSSSRLDCSQKDAQHSSQPSASSIAPTDTTLPNSRSALYANSDANSARPESTDGHPDPSPHTLVAISQDVSSSTMDDKSKRFCNTYNILSKSGLLDITLRTKDLIRQNRRTQRELERLREHTNLYMEALQTGDSEIWSKLHMSVQEENPTS
ncbi:CLOCK-interacting pacemaker [Triplophysa tibetana]|uniref:CLOCK-interacting pacemaker n=1 Tax=Triplophysa tibetana TaxID=1572043 RepID=A0A5A9NGI3_9TELE|nr:CLOCK-interacting pacemaker [Triplophysa tibetana]